MTVRFIIVDDLHAEEHGSFDTYDEARVELKRRAAMGWDERPNVAPCTSWRTCGREYHVCEYDADRTPWKLLADVPVLNVSAAGVDSVVGEDLA